MIYIALIFLIIFLDFVSKSVFSDTKKAKSFFVFSSFLLIFAVCVLRSSSVGRDVLGYEQIYELTKRVDFKDFDYVYFEKGYVLLMKITNLLGLNFQGFLFVIYLIMLLPLAVFIYKYSNNPLLSVVVFLCYMIFEFYLTGLRQAISMSIILIGFMSLIEKKKHYLLVYFSLLVVATFFHKGALICVFAPLCLIEKKPLRFFACVAILTAFIMPFRNSLLEILKAYFDKETMNANAGIYIGTNLIVLLIIALTLSGLHAYDQTRLCHARRMDCASNYRQAILLNLFVVGLAVALILGSETSARSFMYYSIVVIVLVPSFPHYFEQKNRRLISFVFISFFIAYFAFTLFFGNTFDILPYKFFWQ